MLRRPFVAVAGAAGAIFLAMPAAAQHADEESGRIPGVCRTSAAIDGSVCSGGIVRPNTHPGGRLARAILFMPAPGLAVGPDLHHETAAVDGLRLCPAPAAARAAQRPVFARPPRHY